MSLLLAGLAGAARGAGDIANKYIDQEFEQQRADNLMRLQDQQWNSRNQIERGQSEADYQRNLGDAKAESELQHQRDLEKLRMTPRSAGRDHNHEAYQKALLELEGDRINFFTTNEDGKEVFDMDGFNARKVAINNIYGYGNPKSNTKVADPGGNTEDDKDTPTPDQLAQLEAGEQARLARLEELGISENAIIGGAKELGGLLASGAKATSNWLGDSSVEKDTVLKSWKNGKRDGYTAEVILKMSETDPDKVSDQDKAEAYEILALMNRLPAQYQK